MPLVLYGHPLASFCHKVLIALYESGTAFEDRLVDLANEDSRADFLSLWPVGKMPMLRDEARNRTVPETTIIIEYLELHYPGAQRLLPLEDGDALQVRLWDRFFDLYVQTPMQKIVGDTLRPDGAKDPHGVAEARTTLETAYDMIEAQLGAQAWVCGDNFTMADCAAAPALFYAETLVPFGEARPLLKAYYERLLARPSFARVLEEAMPYFRFYPHRDNLPLRFRPDGAA
ncbi:glutathione S-transferase [Rhizobium sp. Root708]|uniref:glutathione S-transferase family protein n=1 Tax=Rhizobium sp. Root708 TaxID=1736592 RepID=UPI0006F42B7D|nr:glutathione S-transferase family protein [Rhizobium sp. Root708]KRB60255.1 glutathione S-transferase [Rhizobium sp. Root708]